jgi:hypothetical protein
LLLLAQGLQSPDWGALEAHLIGAVEAGERLPQTTKLELQALLMEVVRGDVLPILRRKLAALAGKASLLLNIDWKTPCQITQLLKTTKW